MGTRENPGGILPDVAEGARLAGPEVGLTDADRDLIRRATAVVDFRGHVEVITNADTDGGDVGLYHLLGSAQANGEPSATFEQRRGRCYELAGFTFLFGEMVGVKRAMLVHGSMHGPTADSVRIGHAWIEFGDRLVWEPVRGLIRDRAEWEAHARPIPERSYAETTARRLAAQSGHWGRWHESRYP
jgi:hypothetical protein